MVGLEWLSYSYGYGYGYGYGYDYEHWRIGEAWSMNLLSKGKARPESIAMKKYWSPHRNAYYVVGSCVGNTFTLFLFFYRAQTKVGLCCATD